jgi:hypothetical protein
MSSYINSTYIDSCSTYGEPVDWQTFTELRLAWLYGESHEGERRAKTAADVAAWKRLGKSGARSSQETGVVHRLPDPKRASIRS